MTVFPPPLSKGGNGHKRVIFLTHFSFYLQLLNQQDLVSLPQPTKSLEMADPVDCNECRSTFVSFKQYINHLLSRACGAGKKEVTAKNFSDFLTSAVRVVSSCLSNLGRLIVAPSGCNSCSYPNNRLKENWRRSRLSNGSKEGKNLLPYFLLLLSSAGTPYRNSEAQNIFLQPDGG